MKLKTILMTTALSLALAGAAQAEISVKLGVLNDMSSLYADISGPGSVVAANLAVESPGGWLSPRPALSRGCG